MGGTFDDVESLHASSTLEQRDLANNCLSKESVQSDYVLPRKYMECKCHVHL